MARIIYGVSGSGFGHSSRAETIAGHLADQGHEVRFLGSLRSLAYLGSRFPGRVSRVTGFELAVRDTAIVLLDTVIRNISRGISELQLSKQVFAQIEAFAPDLVISDFEPFAVWWARRAGVPCLAVDHQGVLIHLRTEPVPSGLASRLSASLLTRGYYLGLRHHVMLSFFQGEVRTPGAVLVPPVVRRQLLGMEPRTGEHVVCYVSGAAIANRLVEAFRQVPSAQFRIYGLGRQPRRGNCCFARASTEGFLRDLASCNAVIATAGFSLISESLYFRKRMLLLPLGNQYEQELNAHYVRLLGLGSTWRDLDPGQLREFLDGFRLPATADRRLLAPDNRAVFAAIDAKIALLLGARCPLTALQAV